MNVFSETLKKPEPTMAVPFTSPEEVMHISEVAQLADVAEFRADLFASGSAQFLLEHAAPLIDALPTLLTVRGATEGGGWKGTEQDRVQILNTLMPFFDAVDIEVLADAMPEVIREAHDLGKVVIASTHDFSTVPSDEELEKRFDTARSAGADFVKFALTPVTQDDYDRLRSFTIEHANDDIITLAMGAFGPESRIELPGLGSRLTFAFAGKVAVAPGQLSYEETHRRLRQASPHSV